MFLGKDIGYWAVMLNISYPTAHRKITGRTDFTLDELIIISSITNKPLKTIKEEIIKNVN